MSQNKTAAAKQIAAADFICFLLADLSDCLHDIVAEFAAGATVLAACDFELLVLVHADVERSLEQIGFFLLADVGEEHHARSEHRAGIGVLCSALANHSRSRAVDSLEHRVTLADVCAAGCADAALELSSLVGDYVAVEIRENEYLEVAAALLVDELRRGDVNVPLVGHDVGIFLADLLAEVEKLAVRGLDDICLCDYRNAALLLRRA